MLFSVLVFAQIHFMKNKKEIKISVVLFEIGCQSENAWLNYGIIHIMKMTISVLNWIFK